MRSQRLDQEVEAGGEQNAHGKRPQRVRCGIRHDTIEHVHRVEWQRKRQQVDGDACHDGFREHASASLEARKQPVLVRCRKTEILHGRVTGRRQPHDPDLVGRQARQRNRIRLALTGRAHRDRLIGVPRPDDGRSRRALRNDDQRKFMRKEPAKPNAIEAGLKSGVVCCELNVVERQQAVHQGQAGSQCRRFHGYAVVAGDIADRSRHRVLRAGFPLGANMRRKGLLEPGRQLGNGVHDTPHGSAGWRAKAWLRSAQACHEF